MLGSSPVIAVVAVKDLDRAQEFYGGTLGLQVSESDPGGVLYDCAGDTRLLVYMSDYAGSNGATVASWRVDDVGRAIAELKERGVAFEQYDMPGVERDGDVHRIPEAHLTAAWFKDPEGNILNIITRD